MSVFDLPRLHFAGIATTSLPTGPRSGLVDQGTNTALTDDGMFPPEYPLQEYHDYLQARGPHFTIEGRPQVGGPISATKGWNFGANGHFAVDAKVICAERRSGPDEADPIVGRSVDMWGHYNEYLSTTFNRARVFDIDPASNWTSTLMVGQFCFGRHGRSLDVGYLCVGTVHGSHPPRWQNFHHIHDVGEHHLALQLRQSVVYQFVVHREDDLHWPTESVTSPAVMDLRGAVDSGEADGLVVQFALSNMATPVAVNRPNVWDIRGTIGVWRCSEMRTYPVGRLLTPRAAGRREPRLMLHNLTVDVSQDGVSLNMLNAVPVTTRAQRRGPGQTHRLGPPAVSGDLELRTVASDELVAVLSASAYLGEEAIRKSGIITVSALMPPNQVRDEALCVVGNVNGERTVLLQEEELNIQTDDAGLILDHPNGPQDHDQDYAVLVRSFRCGRPKAAVVEVSQYFNPGALPRDKAATSPQARCGDVDIVRVRADRTGEFAPACTLRTDDQGQGWLTVRGTRAGSTRLLLSAVGAELPYDPRLPGSAAAAYDNDDALGFWSGAGSLTVRVLPDDWHLDDIPQDEVTFEVIYREIFAFYEFFYSFMKEEVFSLADRFRVETYSRLIWNMCDPANKSKTYYMPPSRDMSEPKAHLLLKYLRVRRSCTTVPVTVPAATRPHRGITDRSQLIDALRQAVTVELAVMLQYLYAAYSIPAAGAGHEYLRQGKWTPEQLALVCGDGGETLNNGIRGSLLEVAREEMIHFLVVNNILMAVGEPFYFPMIDFGTINHQLMVPLDFALEPLGLGSVQRFIAIEQPEGLASDIKCGALGGADLRGPGHVYSSLSELYGNIRDGLQRVPELFMVEKGRGGGEHHLFMRKSVNAVHPDYQLEVDDLASALFAIDFITEQGEGNVLRSTTSGEDAHFDTFLKISDLLVAEQAKADHGRRPPWSPAYPVLRNPTLVETANGAQELIIAPEAREVARLFNCSYFMMAQLMVHHFAHKPDASLRRSDLMNNAIEVMTGMMRPLAELLVTLPSGRPGKTAGPSFELETPPGCVARPDVAMRAFSLRFAHLAKACSQCNLVPSSVRGTAAYLGGYFGDLARRGEFQ
jgi:chromopyrrolic acid synthase